MIAITAAQNVPTAILKGTPVHLSDSDVSAAFWQTADLLDNDHYGPATIELSIGAFELPDEEWRDLYVVTEPIVAEWITPPEHEGHTLH